MKKHDTIYKKDTTGQIREWYMESDQCSYRTTSGVSSGKMITTAWTVAIGKNIGKSNETTDADQALREVESQYTKKLSGEYHANVADVDNAKFFKPMLAQSWEKRKDKIEYQNGVYVQPKLDGIRCIANRDGVWTRTGKPISSISHIVDMLAPLFEKYPDIVFDGELYNHALKDDFNDIVSMVRKTKINQSDKVKISKMVQYHVYDLPSMPGVFSERQAELEMVLTAAMLSDSVQVVATYHTTSQDGVDALYGDFLANGYEGGIVRLDELYQQKRSNSLIKRKDFEDAEFEILRIEEGSGNWAGFAKRVFFKNDINGVEVGAGLAGTKEYAKVILEQANEYVGKTVTIQFFTRTPDGIPRFPIAKILHKTSRW